ncbi:peptide-methionine (S)-S-oxide reductase MsrA [Marinovum sp. 2_MG-2023]|uniref:peptide-methionine (S)-S-oxide reductase MsrA n=1 Tax=unclassified Marinovum TaxID=2647166 RepID=UPI0026E28A94|nr:MULTISPECIES: peptide-methionine (S)-S-oxide reductase MsrA [unclassified Marinovum]MDO6729821.1 peptide-methionine (S)-S-oxide reductase MsrA [Marinovum sp. 2_MG-2023]MDO6779635.1 peptide-methionine (S)-S-oxide reductase MsrA [Marinovum sp. 1_MG-2023]
MTRFDIFKPALLAALIIVGLCAQSQQAQAADKQVLTVAGGCFWCVEADFEKVKGVTEVVSGYTGGTKANPSYKDVTRGGSGHYEAVQIMFDADVVSRRQLLSLFFRSVDPTDAGGQFCDRGDSYRTAIFANGAQEKTLANEAKTAAQAELGRNIVTPVLNTSAFYPAEDFHQNYYKSTESTLTRFGYVTRAKAYKKYRAACGRDAKVRALWGDAAPFAGS